jgi:hypothetical protein
VLDSRSPTPTLLQRADVISPVSTTSTPIVVGREIGTPSSGRGRGQQAPPAFLSGTPSVDMASSLLGLLNISAPASDNGSSEESTVPISMPSSSGTMNQAQGRATPSPSTGSTVDTNSGPLGSFLQTSIRASDASSPSTPNNNGDANVLPAIQSFTT